MLPFGCKVKIVGGNQVLKFDVKFGQSSKSYKDLPAGTYKATVTRLNDDKTVTKSFKVKAGKTCQYEFNMESYQNGWTGRCK